MITPSLPRFSLGGHKVAGGLLASLKECRSFCKLFSEAATRGVLYKKVFLEISKNSTLLKKETLTQVVSFEFCEIYKNTFFTEHLWKTAYLFLILSLLLFMEKLTCPNCIIDSMTKDRRSFVLTT